MSIRLMTKVWDTNLPAGEKLVLLALADCANDEGLCWPGMTSLVAKTSKCERSVQAAIKSLASAQHLTRVERPGKGCYYTVHPRKICAPAEDAPPQKTTKTPAEIAGKPLGTTKTEAKASVSRKKPAHPLPANWEPKAFGAGTQSGKIVDGWSEDEFATQVEHFKAHHSKKNQMWSDWQSAWSTWVLNNRNFARSANHGQQGSRNLSAATAAWGHPSTWRDDQPF